ncbi:MAG: hypothetical protein ACON5A_03855, partial [Candidatus Comchoanobacterales bacterium]
VFTTGREFSAPLQSGISIYHDHGRHRCCNGVSSAPNISTSHIRQARFVNRNSCNFHGTLIQKYLHIQPQIFSQMKLAPTQICPLIIHRHLRTYRYRCPEKKFEAEARCGQNIYWVAWAVEILAALIGLTIALATAYDAFRDIPDPDLGHYINAIIGALPFLVIAVIEPTKIPLAGGFYKTRIHDE